LEFSPIRHVPRPNTGIEAPDGKSRVLIVFRNINTLIINLGDWCFNYQSVDR
jgi:hypothetical protein